MKTAAKIFAVSALGIGMAAQADDSNLENFNPVRDKLEDAGLLDTFKQGEGIKLVCDSLIAGIGEVTADMDGMMDTVYTCNAAGHESFETIPFNVEAVNGIARGEFTEDVFKALTSKELENAYENLCADLTQVAQQGIITSDLQKTVYSSMSAVCEAYGRPLPEPK